MKIRWNLNSNVHLKFCCNTATLVYLCIVHAAIVLQCQSWSCGVETKMCLHGLQIQASNRYVLILTRPPSLHRPTDYKHSGIYFQSPNPAKPLRHPELLSDFFFALCLLPKSHFCFIIILLPHLCSLSSAFSLI